MSESSPTSPDTTDEHAEAPRSGTDASAAIPAEIAQLSYEDARDQLGTVVQRLESGQAPLDETMALWERGEQLAAHCTAWLDRAETRINERVSQLAAER